MTNIIIRCLLTRSLFINWPASIKRAILLRQQHFFRRGKTDLEGENELGYKNSSLVLKQLINIVHIEKAAGGSAIYFQAIRGTNGL